jgi:hypothetical protein
MSLLDSPAWLHAGRGLRGRVKGQLDEYETPKDLILETTKYRETAWRSEYFLFIQLV